jgi:hypothetical protein
MTLAQRPRSYGATLNRHWPNQAARNCTTHDTPQPTPGQLHPLPCATSRPQPHRSHPRHRQGSLICPFVQGSWRVKSRICTDSVRARLLPALLPDPQSSRPRAARTFRATPESGRALTYSSPPPSAQYPTRSSITTSVSSWPGLARSFTSFLRRGGHGGGARHSPAGHPPHTSVIRPASRV